MVMAEGLQLTVLAAEAGGAITSIAAGLIGVVVGGLISSTSQHRRWLRDTRADAYAHALAAYDAIVGAAREYASMGKLAIEHLSDEQMEQFAPELRRRWDAYVEAESEWKRRRATVELVASDSTRGKGTFLSVGIAGLVALHYRDNNPDARDRDWYRQQYAQWLEREDLRDNPRRIFMNEARIDLAASPFSTRGRVHGRRAVIPCDACSGALRRG